MTARISNEVAKQFEHAAKKGFNNRYQVWLKSAWVIADWMPGS